MANKKLSSGPAARIAMRAGIGCRLKARCCSASVTGQSRSSSSFDVPAERNRRQAVLGAIRPGAPQPQRAPEADGKPQDLHAEQTRSDEMAVLVHGNEYADRHQECGGG